MILASSIDWTYVIVAAIAGLPAIIAAVGVILVRLALRTPSGKPIGRQVEDVLHTALANNYHLRSIGSAVSAPDPPEATAQAAKVHDLPEGNGKTKEAV